MPKILAICTIGDCTKTVKSNKMCAMHWKRNWKYGDPNVVEKRGGHNKIADYCTMDDCDKPYAANGFCQMHYRRWDLYGDPNRVMKRDQSKSAKYKSVLALGHPNANANGMIFEHRLVMTQMLGRALEPGENVHHLNGDRLDNRPENLELWNTSQPAGQRPSDKVEYAIAILRLYAPQLLTDSELDL
jgi:hypothetical protein